MKKALKVFRRRTENAIQLRRRCLGLTAAAGKAWTGREIKLLRETWPSSEMPDIMISLPRHSKSSIKCKASELNLRTIKTFDQTDILDQIRSRASEDGVSGNKLVREVGCGRFIFDRRPNRRRIDYNQIARVVEFFGARLVIDWQDE
jgi:hypothetical protein